MLCSITYKLCVCNKLTYYYIMDFFSEMFYYVITYDLIK